MPLTEFEGRHAPLFTEYVDFRVGLGFAVPASTRRILRHIADYLDELPPVPEVIDRERAEEICAAREGESDTTRQCRIVALRQLCIWLRHKGHDAHVPPAGLVKAARDFVPRVVDESEMARIIEVAESGTLAWAPMALKILWCTGLRIGEVAALRVGDWHQGDRTLYVAHAKNDRSRLIPVSPSLAAALDAWVGGLAPEGAAADGWLFPGRKPGTHRNKVAMSNALRGIYREAEVLTPDGDPIRTHDVRHSFAVRALELMVERGQDVYVTLPLLSAYMGHANIQDTEYYLRLLPSAHQQVLDMQAGVTSVVFGGGRR